MSVQAIPAGFHSVTPYVIIDGADKALRFYIEAFGATEVMRLNSPDGESIMHCEIQIGDSRVMMAEACPAMGAQGPAKYGGSPISLMIYTEDVDAMFVRALEAGAKEVRPLENQFYGDRSGTLEDPFGHQWTIATHIEDVPDDEARRRFLEMVKERGSESGG